MVESYRYPFRLSISYLAEDLWDEVRAGTSVDSARQEFLLTLDGHAHARG